jgi:VanZ family protein
LRHHPLVRWIPALGWAALLLWLGTRTSDALPSGPPGLDKLAHAAFYGVLGLLVARASGSVAAAAGAALLVGLLDEWLQSSTAGRTADWLDLAADVAGAWLGGWVLIRTRRWRGRS